MSTISPSAPVLSLPTRRAARLRRAVVLGWARGGIETRQFFRGREAVIFSLLFPAFMMMILNTMFGSTVAPGVSYSRYLIPGIIASGLITGGFQTLVIQIPIERDRGVLKRLSATPMPKSSYFIGKIIMVIVTSLAQLVLLLVVAKLLYHVGLPATAHDWWTFCWVYVFGITACTLCGLAMSTVPRNGRTAPIVVAPASLVIQFISGVFTVNSSLPRWLQWLADVFPLKWMCQGMRAAWLPQSFADQESAGSWQLGIVAAVVGAWVLLGMVLCLQSFRWTRSREGG